jgi:uridylate kinase
MLPRIVCLSFTQEGNRLAHLKQKKRLVKYKRILLKLSGEALQGASKSTNIDPKMLEQYCEEIKALKTAGVEIAIVIGGGNIFRGGQAEALGIDRVTGD